MDSLFNDDRALYVTKNLYRILQQIAGLLGGLWRLPRLIYVYICPKGNKGSDATSAVKGATRVQVKPSDIHALQLYAQS